MNLGITKILSAVQNNPATTPAAPVRPDGAPPANAVPPDGIPQSFDSDGGEVLKGSALRSAMNDLGPDNETTVTIGGKTVNDDKDGSDFFGLDGHGGYDPRSGLDGYGGSDPRDGIKGTHDGSEDQGDSDDQTGMDDYGVGTRHSGWDGEGGFQLNGTRGSEGAEDGKEDRAESGEESGRSGLDGTGPNSLGGIVGENMPGYGNDRNEGSTIGWFVGGVVGSMVGAVYDAVKSATSIAKQDKERPVNDSQGTVDDVKLDTAPSGPPPSDPNKPNPNNRPSEEGGGTGGPRSNAFMPADDSPSHGGPRSYGDLGSFYMPTDDSPGHGGPRSDGYRPADDTSGPHGPASNVASKAHLLNANLAGARNLNLR